MSEKEKKIGVGDILKTAVSAGVSAASLGEEAVKGLLENAKVVKGEVVGQLKSELKGWLDKVDLSKEIDRVLKDYDLEVKAKISFTKKKNTDESSES
jgi:hypothetical protein